jgi:hypothetical protein
MDEKANQIHESADYCQHSVYFDKMWAMGIEMSLTTIGRNPCPSETARSQS